MNKLTLFINKQLTTFFDATLNYDLEQLAHTFNATIAPMEIEKPLPVEFKINDKSVFVGEIDATSSSTESSASALTIAGRSKSSHMIDSKITMNALYNQSLESLIRSVAGDFGLNVTALAQTETVEEFQINGESAVDNIAQLIKEQGLILIERAGELVIENPAHEHTSSAFTVGDNIESLTIDRNFSNQFYHLEVQGQWNDAHAIVNYEKANKYRKLVLISDQLQTSSACQSRAEYERDLFIAKAFTASTSVPDIHENMAGNLINKTVMVHDEAQNINERLLVKGVSISVNESSQSTAFALIRPFAEKEV